MSEQAVFTMKLESELRAEFMAEAEAARRPASQILRELIFVETAGGSVGEPLTTLVSCLHTPH